MALATVTYSRRTGRLLFGVRQGPLEAAALEVDGASRVGAQDGFAVFAVSPSPRSWSQIRDAFDPRVGDEARAVVRRLEREAEAIESAAAARLDDSKLDFDCQLRTEPMAHQRRGLRFVRSLVAARQPGAGLFMEQGTGKSLVAVGTAGMLNREHGYGWALVVAPNSLKGTWGDPDPAFGEIAKHSSMPSRVVVLEGTRARRRAQMVDLVARAAPDRFTWMVTNYEQFAMKPPRGLGVHQDTAEITAAFNQAPCPGLLVLDESSMVKNHRSNRSRALHHISTAFPFTLLLTGTPVTRSPLDPWSMFQCLRPGILGYATYLAFERAYALHQHNGFGWQVVGFRPGALEELERRVGQYAFRVRARDCLDLPPVTSQRIKVTVSPEQARLASELKEGMAETEEALVDGRTILARYLRLHQILGGFVGEVDREGRALGTRPLKTNPKLEALAEFLDTTLADPEAKVVIFCRFKPEIRAIADICRRRGWGLAEYHGDVATAEREDGRKAFQASPDCRVLLAQYQAGARGLNLTAGNHVVFYSLTFDLEDFLQAQKRVDRIGQDRPVTATYLVAEKPRGGKTLDHILIDSLNRKKGWADVVTGDRREALAALQEVC